MKSLTTQQYDRSSSINFIKPLYYIANLLTLTPAFDADANKSSLIYPVIFISVLTVMSIWILIRSYILEEDDSSNPSLKIMDYINYIAMVLSNLFGTIGVRIINERRIKLFITSCHRIDTKLKYLQTRTSTNKFRGSYLELVLFNVFFLIYTATIFFRSSHDPITLGMDLYEKIQQFHNLILALIIYYLGLYFMEKFRMINLNLLYLIHVGNDKYSDHHDKYESQVERTVAFDETMNQIKMFTVLSNMVDDFNKIFGWQILITAFNSIIGLIYIINIALIHSILGLSNRMDTRDLVVECVLYFIQIVVMGVAIVSSCGMAFDEAQETATVCYKCLEELPRKNYPRDHILREELTRLMHQSIYFCPVFSGAGFFTVDKHMLFGMLGAVTTYIIVLIQFNNF